MKNRIAALAALALLPALLSGCGATTSDSAANVGGAQVSVSQPTSKQVLVPNVTKENLADAKERLAKLNLVPEAQTGEAEAPSNETLWQVDSQFPAPGSMVEDGSKVVLSASQTDARVRLPDVAGQRGDDAKDALKAQGFKVEWNDDVWAASNWIATGTSPKAGSKVAPGSTVTINVTRPPGYDEPSEPADPSTDDSSGLYDDSSSGSTYGSGSDSGYDSSSSSSSSADSGDNSGYEINGGEGNGYKVTCEDGSISHSGGIRGACSWHGGVAG